MPNAVDRVKGRLVTAALALSSVCAFLVSSCDQAAPAARLHERRILTPQAVGALPITSVDAFPIEQRELVRAASAEILRTGQRPAEFYGKVRTGQDGATVDLWHQTAFLPEYRGVVGNPGGRSFTVYFDRDGRVTKRLNWQ
jgi:hypothetical protein